MHFDHFFVPTILRSETFRFLLFYLLSVLSRNRCVMHFDHFVVPTSLRSQVPFSQYFSRNRCVMHTIFVVPTSLRSETFRFLVFYLFSVETDASWILTIFVVPTSLRGETFRLLLFYLFSVETDVTCNLTSFSCGFGYKRALEIKIKIFMPGGQKEMSSVLADQ